MYCQFLPSNHIISNFRHVSHGLARSWFVCLVGRALSLRRITRQVMGYPTQCPHISFFPYLRFLLEALIYNPYSSSTSVLLSRKYYTRGSQDRHASYMSSVRDGTRRSKCMSVRYCTIGNLNICAHLRHPQRRDTVSFRLVMGKVCSGKFRSQMRDRSDVGNSAQAFWEGLWALGLRLLQRGLIRQYFLIILQTSPLSPQAPWGSFDQCHIEAKIHHHEHRHRGPCVESSSGVGHDSMVQTLCANHPDFNQFTRLRTEVNLMENTRGRATCLCVWHGLFVGPPFTDRFHYSHISCFRHFTSYQMRQSQRPFKRFHYRCFQLFFSPRLAICCLCGLTIPRSMAGWSRACR